MAEQMYSFLSGGANGRDKYNYQDAYILSLPGFVWTRAPDPPGGARYGAVCTAPGILPGSQPHKDK